MFLIIVIMIMRTLVRLMSSTSVGVLKIVNILKRKDSEDQALICRAATIKNEFNETCRRECEHIHMTDILINLNKLYILESKTA